MATKEELCREIESLKADLENARKAVDFLGKRNLVEVRFPWQDHALTTAGAPYLTKGMPFGDPDQCRKHVMKPIARILEDVCPKVPGNSRFWASTVGELNFSEQGGSSMDRYHLVPVAAARIIASLIDGAAKIAHHAYVEGFSDGSDALMRMVEGETSADHFNESRQRELAQEIQAHKSMSLALEETLTRHDQYEKKRAKEDRRKPIPIQEIYPGDDAPTQ